MWSKVKEKTQATISASHPNFKNCRRHRTLLIQLFFLGNKSIFSLKLQLIRIL